jgi:hypothetical protein
MPALLHPTGRVLQCGFDMAEDKQDVRKRRVSKKKFKVQDRYR